MLKVNLFVFQNDVVLIYIICALFADNFNTPGLFLRNMIPGFKYHLNLASYKKQIPNDK